MLRLLKLAAMAKHDTGNEQPPDKRIAAAILVVLGESQPFKDSEELSFIS